MAVYYAYEPDDYSEYSAWHHGVSGQKWGVRNGPPYPVQSGTKVRFAKSKMTKSTLANYKKRKDKEETPVNKQVSRDRKVNGFYKVHLSSLSDEQLQRRINRLKLENEYRKLLTDSTGKSDAKKKQNEGKEKSETVLKKMGDTLAVELSKTAVSYVGKRLDARSKKKDALDDQKIKAERARNGTASSGSGQETTARAQAATRTGERVMMLALPPAGGTSYRR